jgi:Peptidase family C25
VLVCLPVRSAVLSMSVLVALTGSATRGLDSTASPTMRLYTSAAGVVRVPSARLAAAGFPSAPVPSDALSLETRGRSVPVWVDDGGDGLFGPGDSIEFLAERLPGTNAYYHEYSPFNVYRLTLDRTAARRVDALGPPPDPDAPSVRLVQRSHLERDRLLVRLNSDDFAGGRQPELWYWEKLTHIDRRPLSIPIDLTHLIPSAEDPVEVAADFFGLSSRPGPRKSGPSVDHEVAVNVAGRSSRLIRWDGRAARRNRYWLDSRLVAPERTDISLRVPPRQGDGDDLVVDVVMLNWIELVFPHDGRVGPAQERLELSRRTGEGTATLRTRGAKRLTVYTERGARGTLDVVDGVSRFAASVTDGAYWIVPDDAFVEPAKIELDEPSTLASRSHQADYLMITTQGLLGAARELADFHRGRGLAVELVDVQDIYDEFNHGIVDPRAIRDFVSHATFNWRRPAPRFVLLIGDASWDTKNSTVDDANYANWSSRRLAPGERFAVKPGPTYGPGIQSNDRQLIPSFNYASGEGHSASDNWFVSVVGDDPYPDLAIGRLPVTEPDEVRAMTDKIERYVRESPVGPWRRRLVWVTDTTQAFIHMSDELAAETARLGFGSRRIFPVYQAEATDQARLREAFDDGSLLTHFVGHGGRYVWRTGPPDPNRQTDLFSLDQVEGLHPSQRLPVVLSLACHTGPFDHPNADSIGEHLLRMEGRGAVAVIAASWRNRPSAELSRGLISELLRPGTVGEALMRAKHQLIDRDLVELYNLLGDPAMPLALPAGRIDMTLGTSADSLQVTARVPVAALGGRLLVEWLDAQGEVMESRQLDVSTEAIVLPVPGDPAPRALSLYYWHEGRQIDALGGLVLPDS